MAEAAARRHLSRHTTDCYCRWVRQFLAFCRDGPRWRHPAELGGADVSRFLTHLAVEQPGDFDVSRAEAVLAAL